MQNEENGPSATSRRAGEAGETGVDRFFIQPHYIMLAYLALGALAWAAAMPEKIACAIWLVCFAAATALHPANGVTALILCVPFFLSPSHRPYIWMVDAMAWWTGLSAAVRVVRAPAWPPLMGLAAMLAAVAALAIPLDFREFQYQIWAAGNGEFFLWALAAQPMTCANYLRVVLDLASGAAVFWAAAVYFPVKNENAVKNLFYSIAILAALNVEAGRLMTRRIVMYGLGEWTYLGLAHSDQTSLTRIGTQAFAYNPQYLVAYTLISAPMAAYFVLAGGKRLLAWAGAAVFLGIIILGLAQSGQRSPFLFFTAFCLVWAYLYRRMTGGAVPKKPVIVSAMAMVIFFAGAWAILGRGIGHGRGMLGWEFIRHDGRVYLWRTAIDMFAGSPLLGVGAGRFTYRFKEFFRGPDHLLAFQQITNIWGEAHSLYFQVLAEEGLFGIVAWAVFLGALFYGAWRALGEESQPEWRKRATLTLCVSLLFWAALGNVNNPFYIRIFGLYIFAAGGIMVALAPAIYGALEPTLRTRRVFMIALAVASGLQIIMAAARPIPHFFEFGFHPWEAAGAGETARWTSKKAVMKIDDYAGDRLKVKVSAPLPWTGKRQKAWFWFGSEKREALFKGGEWVEIEFPPGYRGGADGVLKIRADFTVNLAGDFGGADDRDLGVYIMKIPRRVPGSTP